MHYFYYFFFWWVWTTATNSCFALTNSPNSGDCLGQWTATLFLFSHSFPFSFWETTNHFYCAEDFIDVSPSSSSSITHSFVVVVICCRHLLFSWQTKHRVSSNSSITIFAATSDFPPYFEIWSKLSLSLSLISSSSSTLLAYHQVFRVLDILFCFLVVLAQIWGQNFEIFLFLFVLSNQRFSRLTELDDSSFHELVHERAKIWPISTSQRLLV